jgi:hypothetical protein
VVHCPTSWTLLAGQERTRGEAVEARVVEGLLKTVPATNPARGLRFRL